MARIFDNNKVDWKTSLHTNSDGPREGRPVSADSKSPNAQSSERSPMSNQESPIAISGRDPKSNSSSPDPVANTVNPSVNTSGPRLASGSTPFTKNSEIKIQPNSL